MTEQQRKVKNQWQREYRQKNGDIHTKRYEKKPKGFLMRMYRNMQSRVEGIQKKCLHLYSGKPILEREEFYNWALGNRTFWSLFKAYEDSGYDRKLAPSVDRINSSDGYHLSNMEFVTHSENSRRGTISKCKKYGFRMPSQ